jgi:hypothetical protein
VCSFRGYFSSISRLPPFSTDELPPILLRYFLHHPSSFVNPSSSSGATSRQHQGLRLFRHLFCQTVSRGSSCHLGNHQGSFSFIHCRTSLLTSVLQTRYHSVADRLAAWGLQNSDLTFVRRELRSLLLKYVSRGEASVEYQ